MMEHAFSILMLIFSGALFLYAGITALTKELIMPRRYKQSAKMPDKKKYAVQFAKIMALVACAPLVAGVVGLFAGDAVCAIIVCVLLIAAIWAATIIIRKAMK